MPWCLPHILIESLKPEQAQVMGSLAALGQVSHYLAYDTTEFEAVS